MVLVKIKEDNLGMKHYRYQQYYSGYRIEGAEYILHTLNGQMKSANGHLNLNLPESFRIIADVSEKSALQIAKKHAGGKKFMNPEDHLHDNDQDFAYETQEDQEGELVWVTTEDRKSTGSASLQLCWKFDLYVLDGESRQVFIHAQTGKLVKYYALSMKCDLGQGKPPGMEPGNFILISSSMIIVPLCCEMNVIGWRSTIP